LATSKSQNSETLESEKGKEVTKLLKISKFESRVKILISYFKDSIGTYIRT
jgi:hypothetical protein